MGTQLLDFEEKTMLPDDHNRRELFEVPTDNEGHCIHLTRSEIQMIQKYELTPIYVDPVAKASETLATWIQELEIGNVLSAADASELNLAHTILENRISELEDNKKEN